MLRLMHTHTEKGKERDHVYFLLPPSSLEQTLNYSAFEVD